MDPDKQRTAAREACANFMHTRIQCPQTVVPKYSNAGERTRVVDIELKAWEEQLALYKQQRNRMTGACSLPDEVFILILSILRDTWAPSAVISEVSQGGGVDSSNGDESVSGGARYKTMYNQGWMVILSVCKIWRQIAVDVSSLWTTIPCLDVHPSFIPIMLARTRGLRLALEVDGSTSLPDAGEISLSTGTWLCRPVLRRVKRLRMVNVPHAYIERWALALTHSAPQLEDFIVDEPRDAGTTAILRSNIFSGGLGGLHTLHLDGVIFSWESALFRTSLIELRLVFSEYDFDEDAASACAPSSRVFCEVISSLSALQILSLYEVFPLVPEEQDAYTLALPSGLKQLFLTASSRFIMPCLDMFKRINIPSRTVVVFNLYPNNDEEDPDGLCDTSGCMKRLFQEEDMDIFELHLHSRAVFAQYTERPQDGILKFHMLALDDGIDELPGASVDGRFFRCDYSHDTGNHSLARFMDVLPLASPRTIVCSSEVCAFLDEPSTWLTQFASAHAVKNVSLPYDDALPLLEALYATNNDSMVDDITSSHLSFLLPSLSTIAFHGREKDLEVRSIFAETRGTADVALLDMLHFRKEGGAPLSLLLVEENLSGWGVWDRAKELVEVEFFTPITQYNP